MESLLNVDARKQELLEARIQGTYPHVMVSSTSSLGSSVATRPLSLGNSVVNTTNNSVSHNNGVGSGPLSTINEVVSDGLLLGTTNNNNGQQEDSNLSAASQPAGGSTDSGASNNQPTASQVSSSQQALSQGNFHFSTVGVGNASSYLPPPQQTSNTGGGGVQFHMSPLPVSNSCNSTGCTTTTTLGGSLIPPLSTQLSQQDATSNQSGGALALSPAGDRKELTPNRKRKRKAGDDVIGPSRREKGTRRIDEMFKGTVTGSNHPSSPLRSQRAASPSMSGTVASHLSPIRNFNCCSNSSMSNSEFPSRDISCQTELTVSQVTSMEQSYQAGQEETDGSVLEELRARIEELETKLTSQEKSNHHLEQAQVKLKEMIKELLIENSNLERKTTRQKVMENRLRLGQFVTQRQGTHFEEKWVEGWRFQELEKRRKAIDLEKEEIEKRRKQWNKRKPNTDKTKKPKEDEVSADEFFEQAEVFDLRKMMLNKEDKEVAAELEQLDRERNLHIREIKRIVNEDASLFKDHLVLHNRYLLLNLLGKGGFSEVHKGYDLKEQRYVACKIHQLNPTWPKDKKDNYIKHACREIEIHKTLNHPRIVKVYDVFDIDNDAFCTVLEYCEGNDVDFFLKQNKYIPEREAKSIICQVVSALKYLNERKPPVIHYDLKPGNILLGSGQASGEIKITDFGLSKLMTEDKYNPDTGMDLTSQGAGTYWYLPPECFETGREPPKISSKVDVWSVGIIFFQCLFGRKPFGHNMSQADILHQNTILQAKSITFPQHPKVHESAKEFIKRCVTYRKDSRPDVFQLANDDYLKPKAQLRHNLDTTTLPGPGGIPSSPSFTS